MENLSTYYLNPCQVTYIHAPIDLVPLTVGRCYMAEILPSSVKLYRINQSINLTVGAPQARAQELSDATSTAIFRYISMMMFEQHFTLLQLLVSMERMRMKRRASTKELSLFINGFDKQGLDEVALLESKPNGMTNHVCFYSNRIHIPCSLKLLTWCCFEENLILHIIWKLERVKNVLQYCLCLFVCLKDFTINPTPSPKNVKYTLYIGTCTWVHLNISNLVALKFQRFSHFSLL